MDKELDWLAKKILQLLRVRRAAVDVFLLPDRDIRALKRRFFKKRTEPNVLSFPEPPDFPHPETKTRRLGEVYLNRDILRKSPERAAPLLVHGILHLAGYDHKKTGDAKKMERAERRVLRALPRAARLARLAARALRAARRRGK